MGLTPRHDNSADVTRWLQETENGRIPLRALEPISPIMFDTDLNGPASMYPPAAIACSEMLAAAASDGHLIRVRFSYRTLAKQREKYANYLGPDGKAGTSDDGNLAADIGTSNHGNALSLDLTDLSSSDIAWLVTHAWRYRFDNGDVADEPWHWTYRGGYESEEDVRFDDFASGVRTHRRGENPTKKEKENPDFMLGYNLRDEAVTLPKPPREEPAGRP